MVEESSKTDVERRESAERLLKLFEGDTEAAIAALRGHQPARRPATQSRPSASGEVVVRTVDLTKQYKVGRQRIEALKQVSLEIHEGEFVAFTGPSGSGKSTLLQLIGGLDKPSSGSVSVAGQELGRLSDRKLSTFRNRTVGFVFQFFYLQPFLRLKTNLEVPAMFAHRSHKERAEQAQRLAAAVGLADRLTHLPKELSGGQMQRAAIARALLNQPKLLLADEPTGNLDSTNGQAIIDLFLEVRKQFGTTIVVVTHDPKISAQADREIALKDGEIVS